jgi:hypothetical protein
MNPNGYPFTTRRQILERVESDSAFAIECIAILQDRYEHRGTRGPGMGWMASHAVKATALAAKLASGEVTEKDRAESSKLTGRYAKQLARAFRDRELVARPELGAQAAVFGVGDSDQAHAVAATPSSAKTTEPLPARGKRGRPKGSKNKPKQEQPRRRRARG